MVCPTNVSPYFSIGLYTIPPLVSRCYVGSSSTEALYVAYSLFLILLSSTLPGIGQKVFMVSSTVHLINLM